VWTVDKRLVGGFKNVNENLADVEEKICAVFMGGVNVGLLEACGE
jgi:hypothetical protein